MRNQLDEPQVGIEPTTAQLTEESFDDNLSLRTATDKPVYAEKQAEPWHHATNERPNGNGVAPLCIDLFCGLGGWTEGFLAEGWRVAGFDIERHQYGDERYPADLVLQDVRTIHGKQFRDAHMIVASSPCQEFSYRAMPWKRAKALGPPLLGMELFAQAARIQREACDAAGRHIPMIQENVRGAQKYVGRAQWRYGSFYLWGDVPALMPVPHRGERKTPIGSWDPTRKNYTANHEWNPTEAGDGTKVPGFRFDGSGRSFQTASVDGRKRQVGGSWFGEYHGNGTDGVKQGGDCFNDPTSVSRRSSSRSPTRKAASAQIAKIPAPLARHIARVFKPTDAAYRRYLRDFAAYAARGCA